MAARSLARMGCAQLLRRRRLLATAATSPATAPASVPDELVQLAHELADAAGEVSRKARRRRRCSLSPPHLPSRPARQYFRTPSLAVDTKSDDSPVTRADREAEVRRVALPPSARLTHSPPPDRYARPACRSRPDALHLRRGGRPDERQQPRVSALPPVLSLRLLASHLSACSQVRVGARPGGRHEGVRDGQAAVRHAGGARASALGAARARPAGPARAARALAGRAGAGHHAQRRRRAGASRLACVSFLVFCLASLRSPPLVAAPSPAPAPRWATRSCTPPRRACSARPPRPRSTRCAQPCARRSSAATATPTARDAG